MILIFGNITVPSIEPAFTLKEPGGVLQQCRQTGAAVASFIFPFHFLSEVGLLITLLSCDTQAKSDTASL